MSNTNEPLARASVSDEGRSPLSPSALSELLFRPRRYFKDSRWLVTFPEIIIVSFVCGVAYALGRIDSNIIKAELGNTHTSSTTLGPWLMKSWSHYWEIAVAVGLVGAMMLWFLGPWWYRVRLHWSGAKDLTLDSVRPIYLYQDFVASAPAVLVGLVQTAVYSSYREAWDANEYWSSAVIVFVFWSCVISYKGATSSFSVTLWKARIWFLILPVLTYAVALGVIGGAYALFDEPTG